MLLAVSFLFGLLPGFAWLIFYMGEDTHAEPKRLILLTFFAGIAFGFFTIVIEDLFNGAVAHIGITEFSIFSLVGLALIEELMKFSAAYFAMGKSELLKDPTDVMIYMIVAAMGFATLENIGAISNIAVAPLMSQGALVSAAFQTATLRFVGATLLHALTSAVVGYHWALGIARKKVGRNLALGFTIATILHAIFNYLILNYGSIMYAVVFLVIIGFFVLNDFEKLKVPTEAVQTI